MDPEQRFKKFVSRRTKSTKVNKNLINLIVITACLLKETDAQMNYGQVARKSCCPKSRCPKPESCCPKFFVMSPENHGHVARNLRKKILKNANGLIRTTLLQQERFRKLISGFLRQLLLLVKCSALN